MPNQFGYAQGMYTGYGQGTRYNSKRVHRFSLLIGHVLKDQVVTLKAY